MLQRLHASVMGNVTFSQVQVTAVNGFVYNVTVNGVSGNGTLGLNLVNDGSVKDAVGNSLANPSTPLVLLAPQTFATGAKPYSLAGADLNGDGYPDLVVANTDGNTLSILKGNGNGTFQNQFVINLSLVGSPEAAVLGDLNGDGKVDIATINLAPPNGRLSIHFNQGNATFQSPITLAAGSFPRKLALGDFNNDGLLDVAFTNLSNSTFGVYLNKGQGSFQPLSTFVTDINPKPIWWATRMPMAITTWSFSISAGLLRSIWATAMEPSPVRKPTLPAIPRKTGPLWMSTAMAKSTWWSETVSPPLTCSWVPAIGTLLPRSTYAGGQNPWGLAVGDLNGDNYPDLTLTNGPQTTTGIFLNNGNGTFQPRTTIGVVGSFPSAALLTDLNGDGKPDLAVASANADFVSVLLNGGNASFNGPIYTVDMAAPAIAIISQPSGLSNSTSAQFGFNATDLLLLEGLLPAFNIWNTNSMGAITPSPRAL